MTTKRKLCHALLATSAMCLLIGHASAQSAPSSAPVYDFNLASEDLGDALREFGAKTGRTVVFSQDIVQGKHSEAVVGKFSADSALTKLIGKAAVKVTVTANGVVVVSLADPAAAVAPPTLGGRAREAAAVQTPAADVPVADEIVVTGTRIRGVAPVGSNSIPIDRETIAEQGAASTNDIMKDIPQVTNFGAGQSIVGGTQIQNSSLNNIYVNSTNLRGLGTTATLTLIDGHRIAPSGAGAGYTDSDNIPAIALERVEVVADGASAIYGSDAVAGVVNLVLREPFTGAETSIGGSSANGTNTQKVSQLLGYTWDTGGFMAALEHSTQAELYVSDLPNLYNDNLTPYGGSPQSTVSFPGNVSIAGKNYGVLAGQNGQNFSLSELGPSTTPNRQSAFANVGALPAQKRDTALIKYDQQITDDIKFFGEAFHTQRNFNISIGASGSPGPGYTVPANNPYNPCTNGTSQANSNGIVCPASGALSVGYSWLGDIGPIVRDGFERVTDFTDGLEFKLPYDWKATLAGSYSDTADHQQSNGVNNNAVSVLLAPPGSTVSLTVPGSSTPVLVTHPANIPSLNLFCGTAHCNDPASIAYITGLGTTQAESSREDFTLNADGPLFVLPAGKVRLAVGGEFTRDNFFSTQTNETSTATVTSSPFIIPTSNHRMVESGYAELYVPVVGADNAIPFVDKLDLSLAGRYDHYSDFGGTTNPKYGVNWSPTKGLTIHATYGTSFRAPTLADINPLSGAGIIVGGTALGSALSGASNVVPSTSYASLTTIGGHVGLKPETATTYSAGFDYKPPVVPGLDVSVNYYNIDYENRLDTAANNASFPLNVNASPLLDSFIVYNPTFYPTRSKVTQAQFNALVAAKLASTTPPVSGPPPASTIVALIDGTRANTGTLNTDGFDLSAHYFWDSSWGSWNVGGTATYVLKYDYSQVAGAPALDYDNVYSAIGSPLRFRGRAQFGWAGAGPGGSGITATAFVNYENAYKFPNGVNFPTSLLPGGVALGSYGNINSYTTVDLAFSYDTQDFTSVRALSNVVLRLNVTNLLDSGPPFVLNTANFDPTEASQIGRSISLQLTKRW